ncbi:MAG: hypothetical protein HYU69_05325 [Bacteroidetes bacterium]|nr:hypothetical protein [Bacteroidota bacterium]
MFSFELSAQGCSDAGVCSIGSLGLVQFKYEPLAHDELKLIQIPDEDTTLDTINLSKQGLKFTSKKIQKDSVLQKKSQVATKSFQTDSIKAKPAYTSNYYQQFPKYFFQYTTSYGVGDNATSILTNQLEANAGFFKHKLFTQIKLPFVFINGKLGSVSGPGDITASVSFLVYNNLISNLSLVGGIKFPLNNSNFSKNNLPLPMVYQTSLGTTDALIGAKYSFKKWELTFGYQHSFNANKNEYLHLPLIINNSNYNDYFESNKLKRADDGIVRVNRKFLVKKLNLNAGLLLIYHMANDNIINAKGEEDQAVGSKGLTLNLNFSGIIPVSKKIDLVFIFANPVIVRKSRPDGLTRVFVLIAGIKYNLF